jgi:hypothetical protein
MTYLFLGLCIVLLPVLSAALVITRKSSGEIAALRERLAAEEASKRHFMDQATKHEATIALLYSEQRLLDVEMARR